MSLNLGLSGQPFNGPDIGGFAGNATPDLYGHWIALGAFYPFSRGHTIHGSIPHEPWAFGEDIEDVARTALNRRYKLLPYLYTQFHHASETNLPIMRPVFFADFTDLSLRSEEQAFLLGPDLLIVPQWAEDPRLPGGLWKAVSLVGEDPLNDPFQPVVRQRGGSIVPLGEIIQSTAHYTDEDLTLMVCLDENERATGTLYDDEGEGFGYLEGNYSVTEFEAVGEAGSLRIQVRRTRGERKIDDRRYRIVLITGEGTTVTGDWQQGEVLTLEW